MNDESYFRHVVGFERKPEKNYLFPKTTQQHDQEKASLRGKVRGLEEEIERLRTENLRLKGYDRTLKASPGRPRGRRGRRRH